jgi:cell division protein FtsI (penicillin-binding protein 3)
MLDKQGKRRFYLYLLFITGMIVVLVVNIFIMMLFISQPDTRPGPVNPVVERGAILDRNGRPLAIQTQLYSVEAWVPGIKDIKETVSLLSSVLEISEDEIFTKLHSTTRSVYIQRKISTRKSEKIREYKSQGKLDGILLRSEYGRIYPEQELASHVIGYSGVDNVGLEGIEYTFDDELSPTPENSLQTEVHGNHIVLTIDINIQYMLDTIARQALKDYKADAVMILAMNAKTAEILGYSCIPDFDPNEFSHSTSEQRINRPLTQAYEPGSAFKIFSLASMLELGSLSPHDTFVCNGFYEKVLPDGSTIRIGCQGVHGTVNPELIIKYSCNAGAAYASEKVDSVMFYDKLKDFGFGQRTGLPLPGESYGIFHEPRTWSLRSKPTIAIGQEISVSAVQMLTAATVFSNRGMLLKPLLVKKIVSPDGKALQTFGREEVRRVVSPEVAAEMLQMMVGATENGGTARAARIEGISIAAKTGTAEVADPATGLYSRDKFVASIIGMFPADNPQIILYVIIQHPQSTLYFGSRIAAPVFKKAAQEIISYYDILQEKDNVVAHADELQLKKPQRIQIGSVLPDLHGLPKRQLLALFEAGIQVHIEGDGYVVAQDPPAGTQVKKGMKVYLRLQ